MRVAFILALAFPCIAQRYATLPVPAGNPMTREKVELGRKLFSDPKLSADGKISCTSCHDPKHAFSDPRVLSIGINGATGVRHSPTLIGRGFGASHFWDGRARSLEEQVRQPIEDPKEMGMTLDRVSAAVGLDGALIVQSLASYVRTIRSENSAFDRFLANKDGAFNDLEIEGLLLFENRARCYLCHSGEHLTDEMFHNTGVAMRAGQLVDEGRARITGKQYHRGAFKTPSLREVSNRSPYMHDGSVATLEQVIDYYDKGGNANPALDENMAPLHLNAHEKEALLAFLKTLSGTIRDGL